MSIENESLLSLAEAAKAVPSRRAGRPCHTSCIFRWTQIGCRGVILEFTQRGGGRFTSREALARFFDALTQQAAKRDAAARERVAAVMATARPKVDSKAVKRAEKALALAGV